MHNQRVIVRFDGVQEGLDIADNLCFTVLSSYIGKGGRDFARTSWVGIANLLTNTGIDLEAIQIVARPDIMGRFDMDRNQKYGG